MATFAEKVEGALYGGAIGDAMGAPVEGWPARHIAERFGGADLSEFLPVTHKDDPAKGKGDGRVTDDTLMVEALIRAYAKHEDHMDAYDYEALMIPEIAETKVWVPEYQQEMAILGRLWWPERYPWLRLRVAHAEPRSAGVGNCVNCGVAMWMWPVGAVNAGDPAAAYQEAAALGLAHNESFAVEAGAVLAAAASAGFASDGSIDALLEAAIALARDGTRRAIEAAVGAAAPKDDLERFVVKVRKAVGPYDPATVRVVDEGPAGVEGAGNAGRPSRLHSIEELPVALAALKHGDGDFLRTLRAGVFYGRDCDSIAGMAGALFGAVHGARKVPEHLQSGSDRANRRNFAQVAQAFAGTVERIFDKDAARFDGRRKALGRAAQSNSHP